MNRLKLPKLSKTIKTVLYNTHYTGAFSDVVLHKWMFHLLSQILMYRPQRGQAKNGEAWSP